MTKFSGKSVAAIDQLTIDDDTRAHARSQGYDDEVLHTTCYTISHLAHSRSIGVVGQSHGDSAQPVAEHLGQWYDAVMRPCQVWSKLYGSCIVVAIRCTDTHRLDGLNAAHLLDDYLQSLNASIDIVLNLVVALRLYSRRSLDFATCIHDSKHRVGAS